jgi:hypothetical protein
MGNPVCQEQIFLQVGIAGFAICCRIMLDLLAKIDNHAVIEYYERQENPFYQD